MKIYELSLVSAITASSAMAGASVSTYDDLSEGFLGQSFSYNGVTYDEVNSVDGVFPDGSTFEAGGDGFDSLGNEFIVENASFFYDEFPSWGSSSNALTFGRSFIPGDNLTIGPLSYMSMSLDSNADSASVDLGYFENGPWGGIVLHFEAYMGNSLIAMDTVTLSDLGGRDNAAISTLSVDGGVFDSLRIFATLGSEYSAPRILMDNLTVNSVPAPASAFVLLSGMGVMTRRRR